MSLYEWFYRGKKNAELLFCIINLEVQMDEKYLYDRENVYHDFNPKMEHEWVEYEFEGQQYRV